jgi:hypothetical protein
LISRQLSHVISLLAFDATAAIVIFGTLTPLAALQRELRRLFSTGFRYAAEIATLFDCYSHISISQPPADQPL